MTIKELRHEIGMTQSEMSSFIGCPKRTLENWEEGKRKPPEYIIELIKYKFQKEGYIMEKKLHCINVTAAEAENYCFGSDQVGTALVWADTTEIEGQSVDIIRVREMKETEIINYRIFNAIGYGYTFPISDDEFNDILVNSDDYDIEML